MSSDPGMRRTSAPETENAFDNGTASKVYENTQPSNNNRLAVQSVQQNTISAASEANANARQQVNKMGLVEDNQKAEAIRFANDHKMAMLEVIGAPAIEEMGRKTPAQANAQRHNMATGAAMGYGSPDLASYQASTQDYM